MTCYLSSLGFLLLLACAGAVSAQTLEELRIRATILSGFGGLREIVNRQKLGSVGTFALID